MFYATHDSEEGRIFQNAYIAAFTTREEAVAYLMAAFDAADWNHDSAVIDAGRYGDCWIKVHRAPGEAESYFAPFTADQLSILAPGQHPGGRAWWIEPAADVLVVERIEERE